MNIRSFLFVLQSTIVAIIGTILLMLLWSASPGAQAAEPVEFCATVSPYPAVPDSLPSPARGETLWKENICGACHAADMHSNMTGPALGGVTERWADYPREDLHDWVRQSQKLIGTGHPQAVEVWEMWQPTVMSNYNNLSAEDVDDLLAYIEFRANER